MTERQYKKKLQRIRLINKRLSKIKIGLPVRVEFYYLQGKVICFPKNKKWVIKIKGKNPIIHISQNPRNDVTKHRAKYILKLAIAGLLYDQK